MNIKLLILLFIVLVVPARFYGQTGSTNVIITVDNHIALGSLANMHFRSNDKDGNMKSVDVNYLPGKLSFDTAVINKLFSNGDSCLLIFDYYHYCREKQSVHHYTLTFEKQWLYYSFIVFRIYNAEKKENKKTFYFYGHQYVCEVDTPNGSITKIRRKVSNECD